jgi:16S rRNA (uracil1498-N3)-methyltransferase
MKQLPRFFIYKGAIKRKRFLIEDLQTVNHLRMVLRLKKGDQIELFDGEGREYVATIGFLTKIQVAGIIDFQKEQVAVTKPAIFLAQALPRAGKLDTIVRMNTELGVQGFVLYDTEYSVAKKESYNEQKIERLERVAVEALRQCEGKVLPDFYGAMSFTEALDFKSDYKLVLHSREIEEIKPGSIVIVFIGPEGGFSPNELAAAQEKGAEIVYLDLPILRTETAGVVANAILLA